MRTTASWMIALLLAAGCSGDDDLATDADTDGPSTTDTAVQWGTVELMVELETVDVGGFRTDYYVPESPRGLCFVFHGSNSDVGAIQQIEWLELYNELIPRGIGIVMTNSTEREDPKQWDTFDGNPDTNVDFLRLVEVRDYLIAETAVTESTPLVSLGFSKGGGMANAFGHMALLSGWDFRAFSMHNSGGYQYQIQADGFFVSAENDETGSTAEQIQPNADRCTELGNRCVHKAGLEIPLHPLRFSKSKHHSQEQSENMFQELIDLEYIDADGWRLPSVDISDGDAVERTIAAYQDETRASITYDAAQQLRVVWATHRLSAQFKAAEADFLSDAVQ